MIDYPTNLEEAKENRYGEWSGNPKGREYEEGKCAYEIWPRFGWGSFQCSRKNGHGPGRLYCKQHAKILER